MVCGLSVAWFTKLLNANLETDGPELIIRRKTTFECSDEVWSWKIVRNDKAFGTPVKTISRLLDRTIFKKTASRLFYRLLRKTNPVILDCFWNRTSIRTQSVYEEHIGARTSCCLAEAARSYTGRCCYAYKALHNTDSLHITHYSIMTICTMS